MAVIFINYRSEDSEAYTYLLYKRLKRKFGKKVFIYPSDIDSGSNIKHEIDEALASSKFLVAIIGKRWMDITRRRHTRGAIDYVVYEIKNALEQGMMIFPVLVEEAGVPNYKKLPGDIRSLSEINMLKVGSPFASFDNDVSKLIETIEKYIETSHNLPPPGVFTNRDDNAVKTIFNALYAIKSPHIVVIYGKAGAGKSALALKAAHEMQPRYHGVVWMSSKDRVLRLDDILNEIVRVLEISNAKYLSGDSLINAIKLYLERRKTLLIFDNYETLANDNDISRFIEGLPIQTRVLITGRKKVSLRDAQQIPLGGMSRQNLKEWLYHAFAPTWSASEEWVDVIFEATEGNPFLVKLAFGLITTGKWDRVKASTPDKDNDKDNIYDAFLDVSWDSLTPDAQNILMTMPIFEAPVSEQVVLKIVGLAEPDIKAGLNQLSLLGLLDTIEYPHLALKTFNLHPQIRAYSTNRLANHQNLEKSARKRMFDFYLEYSKKYQKDSDRNFEYLRLEVENIRAAFDYKVKNMKTLQDWKSLWDMVQALSNFLDRCGYWRVRSEMCEALFKAGKRLPTTENPMDTEEGIWFIIYHYAWVKILESTDNYDSPEKLIEDALKKAESRDYYPAIAMAKRNLAVIFLEAAEYDKAAKWCEASLTAWDDAETKSRKPSIPGIDYRRGKAFTLGTQGNIWLKQRDFQKAYDSYAAQKEIYESLLDYHGLSVTAANMTLCAVHRKRPEPVVEHCKEALKAFEEIDRLDDGRNYLWLLFKESQQTSSRDSRSFPAKRLILLRTEPIEAINTPDDLCDELSKWAK